VVDEFVLGIMTSTCVFVAKPLIKLNYGQILADQIHYQLLEFESLRSFRYQYYLVHLFLFFKSTHFASAILRVNDEIGSLLLVIHWTSLIKKKRRNVGFLECIDLFMSNSYKVIYSEPPPKIFLECKKLLRLSPDKRVGDWYIFDNYTKIRVYGCELRPFLLPIFLTPKMFSLQYIRKILNSDDVHFVSRKYKATFKLEKEVGPFIVNSKIALQVLVAKVLSDMGFQEGETWIYDPYAFISSKNISHGLNSYHHERKEEVELLENQRRWKDVKNILQVHGKIPVSPVTKSPKTFEWILKRKNTNSSSKDSKTEEGRSTKRQENEVVDEEEEQEL
jgi:hypothetical protein